MKQYFPTFYGRLIRVYNYISSVACSLALLLLLTSPLPGQNEETKLDAAVTAVLSVHAGRAPSKLLLVPTAAIEAGLANRVAERIGAKSSNIPCGKHTACDPPPAADVLAVSVEIVSIDESAAVVRVVTRGLNDPKVRSKHGPQWAAVNEFSLSRVGKKWVIKEEWAGRT